MASEVALFVGEALAKYGFPEGHPFSIDRQGAFLAEAQKQNLHLSTGVDVPCGLEMLPQCLGLVDAERCGAAIGRGHRDRGDLMRFDDAEVDAGVHVFVPWKGYLSVITL